MTLFVDADSCSARIREIVCKTAQRLRVSAVFVANRIIPIPKNDYCRSVVTAAENQAADSFIVSNAVSGDIVITRDIPLAQLLVDAQVQVINDRGTVYTAENIRERLSIRNFMYELHANGLVPERTKTFGKKEVMDFARALDHETQRILRNVL